MSTIVALISACGGARAPEVVERTPAGIAGAQSPSIIELFEGCYLSAGTDTSDSICIEASGACVVQYLSLHRSRELRGTVTVVDGWFVLDRHCDQPDHGLGRMFETRYWPARHGNSHALIPEHDIDVFCDFVNSGQPPKSRRSFYWNHTPSSTASAVKFALPSGYEHKVLQSPVAASIRNVRDLGKTEIGPRRVGFECDAGEEQGLWSGMRIYLFEEGEQPFRGRLTKVMKRSAEGYLDWPSQLALPEASWKIATRTREHWQSATP